MGLVEFHQGDHHLLDELCGNVGQHLQGPLRHQIFAAVEDSAGQAMVCVGDAEVGPEGGASFGLGDGDDV